MSESGVTLRQLRTDAGTGERPAAVPVFALVAAVALGAVAFAPGVSDMVGRWMATGSYYGHGPFVPLACAWIAWRERRRLAEAVPGSSALGLVLVGGSILLLAVSLLEDIHFTQNAALLGAITGTALVLFGATAVRHAWFALAYLAFMVPLPQVAIANLTFDLKMLAARLSVAAIELAGLPVVLEGSTIHLQATSVTVDDVCSGLRTLVALVAIASLFAYLERNRWRSLLTLALAGPIAIVANVIRILILCWLAAIGSSAAREGPLHEATGLLVYAVALGCLLLLRSIPVREGADAGSAPREDEGSTAAAGARRTGRGPSRARVVALLAMLAVGAAASATFALSQPALGSTDRTKAIPLVAGGWQGIEVPVEPRVKKLLDTEDLIIRRYARQGTGSPVDLYVVHSGDSRKVAHPPEICFSGGGFIARERTITTLPGAPRTVPAVRMVLDKGAFTLLVYYWYRLDGRDTASFLDHQLDAFLKLLRRERREGTMIRLSTAAVGPEGVAAAEKRMAAFTREAMTDLLAPIP